MATAQPGPEETARDFEFPQREAAFFYGLFLRGHSAEELRRDIEVPPAVLARWNREAEREPSLREMLHRVLRYRRHVLAIFESLVGCDSQTQRIQWPAPLVSLPGSRIRCLSVDTLRRLG